MHQEEKQLINRAEILLSRLERLSADSSWAHRASGLRGSLLRAIGQVPSFDTSHDAAHIQKLVERGYEILNQAAREIPDLDDKK